MNPTDISSNPDLEMEQRTPKPSAGKVCTACGATNVTTQFCTNCGADVTAQLEPGAGEINPSVKNYLKAVVSIKAGFKQAVRAWFPFAWRTAMLAIPPFIVICAVVFFTILITSGVFARIAMESHSLDSSEAARLMEETQNRVLHNLGELRIATFALLIFCVSPVAFKSRSIQRALGRQPNKQPVSLKNAVLTAWNFHWRFWILLIPATILIWLLAYKPIVLFGEMTKGDEELVKRVADNVTEVLILLNTAS